LSMRLHCTLKKLWPISEPHHAPLAKFAAKINTSTSVPNVQYFTAILDAFSCITKALAMRDLLKIGSVKSSKIREARSKNAIRSIRSS